VKIAVIGSGISGMGAAFALKDKYDVTLYEAEGRFGGHANTQTVDMDGTSIDVDTGFIVYNHRNYPNLVALFDHLGVETKWSDMSFGVSLLGGGFEYACDNIDKLFAQRRNALKPGFFRFLKEIRRFHETAPAQLDRGDLDHISLGDWTSREGYSQWFRSRFILPMGGAIWSTPIREMMDFPAKNFVSFFKNHDLMTGLDPAQRWRTVEGGSISYVEKLISSLGSRAVCNAQIRCVGRSSGKPRLTFADGSEATFDHVILATHAPTSARLLQGQSDVERHILSQFRVSKNKAILHSDPSLMPKRKKVWSSWNFLTDETSDDPMRPAPVTYWMNRLQSIPKDTPLFVSLNPSRLPEPDLVHATFDYDHPIFGAETFEAQRKVDGIQGQGGVWYAGAWLGYGFHEDGLRSGLRVASALGVAPDWLGEPNEPFKTYLDAAE